MLITTKYIFCVFLNTELFEPAHEILVLIVPASSQFASHSLVRASIKCVDIEKNLGPTSEYSTPSLSSATSLNGPRHEKFVFGVSDKARFKPACSATEPS